MSKITRREVLKSVAGIAIGSAAGPVALGTSLDAEEPSPDTPHLIVLIAGPAIRLPLTPASDWYSIGSGCGCNVEDASGNRLAYVPAGTSSMFKRHEGGWKVYSDVQVQGVRFSGRSVITGDASQFI